MPTREELARLHDEESHSELATQRGLSAMAAEEREMERAMKAFEEDADQTKRFIEAEWRWEHWGHDPERLPAWETTPTRGNLNADDEA